MHELERGSMVWGEWSEHSRAFLTDRDVFRRSKPARHIWVLVHGLRGDSDDLKYLAGAVSSRWACNVRNTELLEYCMVSWIISMP